MMTRIRQVAWIVLFLVFSFPVFSAVDLIDTPLLDHVTAETTGHIAGYDNNISSYWDSQRKGSGFDFAYNNFYFTENVSISQIRFWIPNVYGPPVLLKNAVVKWEILCDGEHSLTTQWYYSTLYQDTMWYNVSYVHNCTMLSIKFLDQYSLQDTMWVYENQIIGNLSVADNEIPAYEITAPEIACVNKPFHINLTASDIDNDTIYYATETVLMKNMDYLSQTFEKKEDFFSFETISEDESYKRNDSWFYAECEYRKPWYDPFNDNTIYLTATPFCMSCGWMLYLDGVACTDGADKEYLYFAVDNIHESHIIDTNIYIEENNQVNFLTIGNDVIMNNVTFISEGDRIITKRDNVVVSNVTTYEGLIKAKFFNYIYGNSTQNKYRFEVYKYGIDVDNLDQWELIYTSPLITHNANTVHDVVYNYHTVNQKFAVDMLVISPINQSFIYSWKNYSDYDNDYLITAPGRYTYNFWITDSSHYPVYTSYEQVDITAYSSDYCTENGIIPNANVLPEITDKTREYLDSIEDGETKFSNVFYLGFFVVFLICLVSLRNLGLACLVSGITFVVITWLLSGNITELVTASVILAIGIAIMVAGAI